MRAPATRSVGGVGTRCAAARSAAALAAGRCAAALALALVACDAPRAPSQAVPVAGARREVAHPGALHEIHVSGPALAVAGDGAVHLAWTRRDAAGASVLALRLAPDTGELVRVDPHGFAVDASHDAPGLAVGPGGAVYVAWVARRPPEPGAPFASDLLLSSSRDGGASFEPPLAVGSEGAHSRGYQSLALASDGVVWVAWLEGGATSVARAARVDPATGRVTQSARLGESACPCCRTAVAVGPGDALAVLWRAERPGKLRDMVWARATDAGRRFAAPELVHADGWSLDACPHRGGSLAFDGAGRAAAVWYTEGAGATPSLRLATALPRAAFGAPREVHEEHGALPDRAALALRGDGLGLVAFESATAVRREIAARAVDAEGRLGPVLVLSRAVQASGPAVATLPSGDFAVAWNEAAFPTLRTVVVTVSLREPGAPGGRQDRPLRHIK